jgi:tetratricopeptide (TPR) repeat protein
VVDHPPTAHLPTIEHVLRTDVRPAHWHNQFCQPHQRLPTGRGRRTAQFQGIMKMPLRALLLALAAMLVPAPAAAGANVADLGPAGVLMLDKLPACLEEDFASAYQKCLPARPATEAAVEARSKALIDRAILLIYMRRWDEARQELDLAIAATPRLVEPRHLAGRVATLVYMERHESSWLDAARAYLSAARELAPRNADVRASEAFLVGETGQTDEAIRIYGEAIALQPKHAFSLGRRGMLLEAQGWPERAIKDYDDAIAAAPEDPAVRRARADLLVAAGKPREALGDLDALLKQNKHDFMAIMMRAAAHQMLREYDAALEDLHTLIYGPKDGIPFATGGEQLAGFLMQRAMVLVELKRNLEAAEDATRAVELGGKQKILRLQVYLRRHGFSLLRLDGLISPALTAAIEACFGRAECREGFAAEA